jgi:competence protein ComEC
MYLSVLIALFAGHSTADEVEMASESDDLNKTGITISNVSFVAPAPEKENLNEEWVEIKNFGDNPQNLTGWTLADEGNHQYTFPEDFTIDPGALVKVHTGSGEDTATDLYWNRSTPVWNNDGDIATLRDSSGNVVAEHVE